MTLDQIKRATYLISVLETLGARLAELRANSATTITVDLRTENNTFFKCSFNANPNLINGIDTALEQQIADIKTELAAMGMKI